MNQTTSCLYRLLLVFWSNLVKVAAAVGLLFAIAHPVSAQGGAAVVHPDPPTLEVGQGQVEALNILIENAQDAYGIEVRAKFDPSVIEIADADPAKDGVQMIPGDFIKPDFLVRNTADNKQGTLQYVITEVNPTPPANGTGVVFTVLIRGRALGKKSSFTIEFVDIADRHGTKLAVKSQNGTVSVVAPKPPTATPTGNAKATLTPTAGTTGTPAITRGTPTVTPAPTVVAAASNTDRLVTAGLVLVAGGGCLGTVALVAVAAFLLFARPRRRPNPPQYYQPYQRGAWIRR